MLRLQDTNFNIHLHGSQVRGLADGAFWFLPNSEHTERYESHRACRENQPSRIIMYPGDAMKTMASSTKIRLEANEITCPLMMTKKATMKTSLAGK